MSNTLKFSGDKRLSSQLLVSHRLSKEGRASIFNLMPLLPPRQTQNKQYLSIKVSRFVTEGFGLIHRQHSLPASMDLICWKGNDQMKCLTYCKVGDKIGHFCLHASTISQYKIYYWAFQAANRHLYFLSCPNLHDYKVLVVLFRPLPIHKSFINKTEWKSSLHFFSITSMWISKLTNVYPSEGFIWRKEIHLPQINLFFSNVWIKASSGSSRHGSYFGRFLPSSQLSDMIIWHT